MRTIGAAARCVLLQAAADQMQVPVEELVAKDSVITHPTTARTATYAELAPAAAKMNIPDKPTLKDSSTFRIMGTSPPRIDVPAKTDGSAKFGIDAVLPNMKYAAIRSAPVFGGKVQSVDESSIQNMPGVRKVISLGTAVAVVADGYWQAHQALLQLKIAFSGNSNNLDQAGIFEQFAGDLDRSAAAHNEKVDFLAGDAMKVLAKSATVVTAEYRVPFLAHATMEPMNCTAWVHDNKCELWLGCQDPLRFARKAARAIGFDSDDVIVHNQYLGGGFGRRWQSDFAEQAAQIAAQVHYPVKLIWSREEDMQHDHYRQACISRFQGGLDDDGNASAWHNRYVNKHEPRMATHIPYAIENQRIVHTVSRTRVPWGIWRSVDHSLHAFFTESFIDEMADAAGRDSYEYRRDLLAHAPRLRTVLDLAAQKAGWGNQLPQNFGRGISIHQSFGTIVSQVAEVEILDGDPRVHRVVCAVDAGFAIHPDGLIAQMESGIAYGLTAALHGEISIRGGAVEQSNFHDYPMLRMNEAPAIETYIINSGNSLGGAGEPGTPPIAPAVTNAIFNATGIRIRELPILKHGLSSGRA
jgi:isoquinoline 1-oxidoreductase beta subunit